VSGKVTGSNFMKSAGDSLPNHGNIDEGAGITIKRYNQEYKILLHYDGAISVITPNSTKTYYV
jgi:hypothetical protein